MRAKRLFTMILLGAPLLSQASGIWVSQKTIKNVRAQNAAGQVSFVTHQPIENPANCAHSHYYGITAQNHPELALSVLLSAHLSEKSITFFVLDNACDAFNRPSVTDVQID